ncbi:uncharacterized protein LOC131888125 [Tigriopus californicus]|uniref:uncharacterized protein LOC131888125 n=1 Tax=Tigriopus californicus TaxID=6832 RepID=UPI0027DA4BC6|nr:uncharacterized protein LOC131888125 [Tigriopus californicus]
MVNGILSKESNDSRKRTRQDNSQTDEILLETEPGEVPWEDDQDDIEVASEASHTSDSQSVRSEATSRSDTPTVGSRPGRRAAAPGGGGGGVSRRSAKGHRKQGCSGVGVAGPSKACGKLAYKCTGYWKEDHGQVSYKHYFINTSV